MSNEIIKKNISSKIFNHFSTKYPATFIHTGLDEKKILQIVESTNNLNQNSIKKIIEIIDRKITETTYQNNRKDKTYETSKLKTDTVVNINIDKYLNNFNPLLNSNNEGNVENISLSNDNQILENVVGADSRTNIKTDLNNLSNYNTIRKDENNPFSENFPLKDREKDMLSEETKEFNYYIVIDSKDRNREKDPSPNNFSIEFSPSSSDQFATSNGYVERGFGNISKIEILDVIVLDTSCLNDSSDANNGSFPYLLLNFDEFKGDFYGTNNDITRSFAVLKDYSKKGSYRYYNLVGNAADVTLKKEFNPRINLNKLTTRILLPDGSNFNFGSSSDSTSNSVVNITMKVTTLQKNLSTQFINKATY